MAAKPNAGPYPRVQGTCPACHLHSLFLGDGGYVTCGYLPCSNPTAAADLLDRGATFLPEPVASPSSRVSTEEDA